MVLALINFIIYILYQGGRYISHCECGVVHHRSTQATTRLFDAKFNHSLLLLFSVWISRTILQLQGQSSVRLSSLFLLLFLLPFCSNYWSSAVPIKSYNIKNIHFIIPH